jgi:hypothetical protein
MIPTSAPDRDQLSILPGMTISTGKKHIARHSFLHYPSSGVGYGRYRTILHYKPPFGGLSEAALTKRPHIVQANTTSFSYC